MRTCARVQVGVGVGARVCVCVRVERGRETCEWSDSWLVQLLLRRTTIADTDTDATTPATTAHTPPLPPSTTHS